MSSLQQSVNRMTSTWWIVLLESIIALAFGLLLLFSPIKAALLLLQFIGIYWLISGIFAIFEIFAARRTVARGWLLLYGIIGILAGLVVWRHPLISMILLPRVLIIVFGIVGILMGLVALIQGVSGRSRWRLVLALLNILIGIFLLTHPLTTALVLPPLIGIAATIAGLLLLTAALRMRHRRMVPEAPGQGRPVS